MWRGEDLHRGGGGSGKHGSVGIWGKEKQTRRSQQRKREGKSVHPGGHDCPCGFVCGLFRSWFVLFASAAYMALFVGFWGGVAS